VAVKRIRRVELPVAAERLPRSLRREHEGVAEQLVDGEASANLVAKGSAVAPVSREIDALTVDVRVAELDVANGKAAGGERAARNRGDFVRRLHVEEHAASRVGQHEYDCRRDERLRAEETLGV